MNLVLTNQKISLLAVNIILGAILVYSYYHYITKGGVPINTLWGKVGKVKNLYLLSMILSFLGYAALLIFVVLKTPNTKINGAMISNLMVIQVIIITISMIWLPMTLLYLKERSNKQLTMFAVLVTLFIVALASAKQFLIVKNITPENNQCARTMKTLGVLGAGIIFVHTFFLDFIGWNIGFFS